MQIELKCGNVRIVDDAHGYVIQERYLYTPTKADEETGIVPPPEYRWRDRKFYGKLDQAIKGVLDWRLHESEATTLAELAEDIRAVKAEIADLFKIVEVAE